jgi:acylphosphatase
MQIRVHIFINGKVQGVFFRSRIVERTDRLGVTGWVKNLLDGRVEAVLEGEKEGVEEMINFCKIGPPRALVKNVEIRQEVYTGEYKNFALIN